MDSTDKHNDDIAYFVAFCIEKYKNANRMTGAEVSDLFDKTGLADFLVRNYDAIHTQSADWILEEINDFLKVRGTMV